MKCFRRCVLIDCAWHTPWGTYCIVLSIYRWKSWGSERALESAKVTELTNFIKSPEKPEFQLNPIFNFERAIILILILKLYIYFMSTFSFLKSKLLPIGWNLWSPALVLSFPQRSLPVSVWCVALSTTLPHILTICIKYGDGLCVRCIKESAGQSSFILVKPLQWRQMSLIKIRTHATENYYNSLMPCRNGSYFWSYFRCL